MFVSLLLLSLSVFAYSSNLFFSLVLISSRDDLLLLDSQAVNLLLLRCSQSVSLCIFFIFHWC